MFAPFVCAVVGLFATVAAAQPSDDAVERLLAKMDAPTLAEREDAERELFSQRSVTLEQIEELARRDDLSPEQTFRLRKAARSLFTRRPMAGMGVQFQGFSPEGVIIGQTIPGFPAHEVLEPLDTIVTCNGQRMRTQDDLRWAILSRDPGDPLTLEIVRSGATRTIEVRLGAFDDLPNAQRPTPLDVANAFTMRWARSVDTPAQRSMPIGAVLTVERWAQIEAGQSEEERSPQWPLTRDSASRLVSFGGRPRSALAIRQALADFTIPAEVGGASRGEVSTIAAIVDQMRSLSRQRIVVDQRARTLETHADMVADPARRDQLLALRNAALQESIDIERELASLREALRIIRETGGE